MALSLDDFGTGYSSLVRLKRLPVTEVKVDASFVGRLLESPDDLVVVKSIVDLAAALGIRSVAEGVETADIAAALLGMGCVAGAGLALLQAAQRPRRRPPGWRSTATPASSTAGARSARHAQARSRAALVMPPPPRWRCLCPPLPRAGAGSQLMPCGPAAAGPIGWPACPSPGTR